MYLKPMRLNDILSHHIDVQHAAKSPDVFGVEVELEGKHVSLAGDDVMKYWSKHQDGSLRAHNLGDDCIEYVSIRPLNMVQTQKSIEVLFEYLNSQDVTVYDSYRTSIHVHVNFGMETFRTIYNFMTLSLILDELLVSQNGEHRIGNNFCLRARDAMGQLVTLCKSINSGRDFFYVNNNDRYSSINFVSLLKFGSIEFRSLECTTHEGRVMHWIGTLQRIKERARKYKNPTEVIQQFSMMDAEEFLMDVLGPYAMKYLPVEGRDSMLQNGVRIAQDLAFCSAWNEQPEIMAEKLPGVIKKVYKKADIQ